MSQKITTGLGTFSKEKFDALITVRSEALRAVRKALIDENYTEVSTSSLVNIAGSCENPYASFKLNYYGRDAHLSQSAQLQLEALVIRLKRAVFTVNNSFREEHYDDPESAGRRLSEFTLIEPECPFVRMAPDACLDQIIATEERLIKAVIRSILSGAERECALLGGRIHYLTSLLEKPFIRISYDEALKILNRTEGSYHFGDDLGIKEERVLLKHVADIPLFVTHYPTAIKFFNMKRTPDERRVYSVDLLTPRLGETAGGAVREEDGEKITRYFLESRIATYVREYGDDPLVPFAEYLRLFKDEKPVVRGGFGIGFERMIGFLTNSNDILETVAYRAMQPS
ncbi:hypothetical protein HY732_01140 [Candidatus Uhrbacteria bacterium]|nr:hypothetical protein [Candidatus Uhrbacteria bacterium]